MSATIRFATSGDRSTLLSLWDQTFPGERESAATFLDRALGRVPCLLASKDNAVVGMVFGFDVVWRGETYRYLYALAVATACREQGLGAALMAAVETEARTAGCAGTLGVVMPDGPWGFYRRLGYSAALRRRSRRPGDVPAESVRYPTAFLEIACAFGESSDAYRPDPNGTPYGIIKRFDGALPHELPFLSLTLE